MRPIARLAAAAATVLASVAGLLAAPAAAAEVPRGHLVLIGGGEIESPDAIDKIVELAGGKDASIVVIPTASEEPTAAEYYSKLFTGRPGCTNVVALPITTREDAARPEFVAAVANARAIFFGGGDQVRITDAILGTPVGDAIAAAFARGAVVGGTSAGTACQSAKMITGEGDFKVIRAGAVELKRGFGFFPGVIVDQHFIARQRENRLITVILENPDLLGVGVDEDTAAWVKPDGTFEVLGSSAVIVFDPGKATVRRAPAVGGGELLAVRDMKMHVLVRGDRYDLRARKVIP